MKPGSILVNTAPGGLVDEAALAGALRPGHLMGAGLHVLTVEPPPAGYPLFALHNVVVAPHTAWLTPETIERSVAVAMENCHWAVRGQPLLHQVV